MTKRKSAVGGTSEFATKVFGPAKKGHLVLAFQEKMNLDPRLEDGQGDEEKMRLMARGRGKGEQGTKVAPTNEGGHTGPPLRNASPALSCS
jgi:hypothetical protein